MIEITKTTHNTRISSLLGRRVITTFSQIRPGIDLESPGELSGLCPTKLECSSLIDSGDSNP
eukprot:4685854-Amphidinium_carterae.1